MGVAGVRGSLCAVPSTGKREPPVALAGHSHGGQQTRALVMSSPDPRAPRVGMQMAQLLREAGGVLKKSKPERLAIPCLGIYPPKMKTLTRKDMCSPMFSAYYLQ